MTEGLIYSLESKGNLEDYLRDCSKNWCDNLFQGPEPFFLMRDKGLIIPNSTVIRVDQINFPDIKYYVNSDFLLQSYGKGPQNMSVTGAEKGIYDPNDALKDQIWSIHGLNLHKLNKK